MGSTEISPVVNIGKKVAMEPIAVLFIMVMTIFSGGNKRKLSTAIALVGNPPIILLVSVILSVCLPACFPTCLLACFASLSV